MTKFHAPANCNARTSRIVANSYGYRVEEACQCAPLEKRADMAIGGQWSVAVPYFRAWAIDRRRDRSVP